MDSLHFISKAQFEGVYSHFKQVGKDADASKEELQIECRLLLGYFRSLYEDSERKSNKITHLTSEIRKYDEKFKEIEKKKEKYTEELKQKLAEMKITLDNHRKGQVALIQLNDELSKNISNLKDEKSSGFKKSQSDIYINRRPTAPQRIRTRFREIAVGSSTILQSSRSFKSEKDLKKEQGDKCSMPREINFMKRKYEDEIGRLQNQVKVISAEAKLFHSEADSLRNSIENKDRHFSLYKQRISEEKNLEKQEKESLQTKNSSLQMMVDNFVNDLRVVKDEKRLQQEDNKNFIEERYTLLLQIQEKNKYIENLKSNIDSLTKSKQSAVKKACVFEENLTIGREELTTAKKNMDALNRTIDNLQTNLHEKESELNQQESLRERLEVSQKCELLKQAKMLEYYKAQLATRDKRIKSLTTELEQTNEKLAFCRRQLRNKRRENAMLSEEFKKWKTNLGINTENLKSLKARLDSVETSKSELQSELKFTRSQYFSVLKEKNKLLAQCKQLDSVIEYRELENDLLNNRQNYLQNNLKMKDSQIEKIAKLRRLAWTKQ